MEITKENRSDLLKLVKKDIEKQLFAYNTIKVNLIMESRSLEISLNQVENSNCIHLEMVKELQDIFNWCHDHLEVQNVLLNSKGAVFSQGLDLEEASTQSNEDLIILFEELRQLSLQMLALPQTIVGDLGDGATGIAAELMLFCDIRMAKKGCRVHFNHLRKGLTPGLGGVGILSKIVGQAYARQWILSSRIIPYEQLVGSGLVIDFYSDKKETYLFLKELSQLSSIAKIQAKASFLESINMDAHFSADYESMHANATIATNEWKRAATNENFLKANHLKLV